MVRKTIRNRQPSRRRLRTEHLEGRRLLAGDVGFSQNFWEPTDVNGDSQITPVDALIVINRLSHGGEREITGFTDVNGDGDVTPVDALNVINHLSDGDAAPRIQSQLNRLQAAAETGDLPEGVTVDQVNDRIAVLQTAIETGVRPEGTRPEGVGRPTGVRPSFAGQNREAGGYSAERVQSQIERLQGDLPEGVTAEQANARIEMLETALETGERPEGTRPDGVGRAEGVRPSFARQSRDAGGYSAERVQAQIERLQGDLPEGVTAEQANARIEMLETALETGERPEGTRPDGVGRPEGMRPSFGRPSMSSMDSAADQMQAREQFFANFAANRSGRPSFGRPF